jgi:hypothetical protein
MEYDIAPRPGVPWYLRLPPLAENCDIITP